MCGNCVHAKMGSRVSRGRLASDAPILAQALKMHTNPQYLSVAMVKTLEKFLKISEWSSTCKKEKIRVKLLEPACSYWQPTNQNSGRLSPFRKEILHILKNEKR